MKGISPKDTFTHVCLQDRELPKEEQTIFTLGYLSVEQEAHVDDSSGCTTNAGYQIQTGTVYLLCLHYGLKSITNLPIDGKEIVLERDETKPKLKGGIYPWKLECLNKIPKSARNEIAQKIRFGGELEEEERKN